MVTGTTVAAFEPALDYVVVKLPRFPFDKFPTADRRLGSQMKATGEVMAIDRTFGAALNKALRGLEQAGAGPLGEDPSWRPTFDYLAAVYAGAAAEADETGWAAGEDAVVLRRLCRLDPERHSVAKIRRPLEHLLDLDGGESLCRGGATDRDEEEERPQHGSGGIDDLRDSG